MQKRTTGLNFGEMNYVNLISEKDLWKQERIWRADELSMVRKARKFMRGISVTGRSEKRLKGDNIMYEDKNLKWESFRG